MSFIDWLPAITVNGLIGLALWLGRTVITTRLTKAVEHEFNERFEAIKAEHRQSEEIFKSELRTKEIQISNLRSGALTGIVNRQATQEKRRLDAVDQLWSAMQKLTQLKGAATIISVIKFEEALAAVAKEQKPSQLFKAFEAAALNKEDSALLSGADMARLHVSDLAWALFSAYKAIVILARLQLEMLKSELDAVETLDTDSAIKIIKSALPDHAGYIDKNGIQAAYHLLDELELRLLKELRRIMEGKEIDQAAILQSADVMKHVDSLNSDMELKKIEAHYTPSQLGA
jgi:hypothetical protein